MSKFNFNAPITDMTSYGLVALNVIENSDCDIFPINQVSIHGYDNQKHVALTKRLDQSNLDPSLPSVRLYHQFSLAESIGRGKRIGWPIFELDQFNARELAHLKSLDHIVVCSNWAKTIIEQNGITTPTTVAPLGVDRNIFSESMPSNKSSFSGEWLRKPRYCFLSCGKYELRKGQDQIVEAFNAAFEASDSVHLWLSMHNQFIAKNKLDEIKSKFKRTKLGDKISFIGPFRYQSELANFMRAADCGVFPSKTEGWGLETLEMMSCGKPVIVSNYSGHTEYCNDKNSILIPVSKFTEAYDGIWFHGQGGWADIETDILIEKMRYAYKERPDNPHGIETANAFSWQNTCHNLEKAF